MSLEEALWQDPDRMSGALCFRGTRIPVSILFDYLGADGLAEFREGYPDVSEAQVGAVLANSRLGVEERYAARAAA